jgi:MarR family transcriptional regulator, organic hydroperoxide resistance regulator
MDKPELINQVVALIHTLEHGRMHDQFERWRKLDVPLAQLKSLFIINFKGSLNVRSLAADLGVTPGDVTSIVDRLVAQGLVKRLESPGDRRIVLLELTDKGRQVIIDIHQTAVSHIRRALEKMTAGDIGALARGLEAFSAAMDRDRETIKKETIDVENI